MEAEDVSQQTAREGRGKSNSIEERRTWEGREGGHEGPEEEVEGERGSLVSVYAFGNIYCIVYISVEVYVV